jgi:hypothetical protein
MAYVPDIGETFAHCMHQRARFGGDIIDWLPPGETCPWQSSDTYRVDAWLCPSRVFTVTPDGTASEYPEQDLSDFPEPVAQHIREMRGQVIPRGVGTDHLPLRFCRREEATHVSGYGVSGVIVPAAGLQLTGRVSWSEETIAEERESANRLAGHSLI